MKLLHAGCGPIGTPVPPQWRDYEQIRYDVDATVAPDLVGTLTQIDLPDGAVDALYASHVLEHLDPWDVDTALAELYRVLKVGGAGLLIVPDLTAWARLILSDPAGVEDLKNIPLSGPISVLDALYGYGPDVQAGRDGMRHRTMFTPFTFARHLDRAGFVGHVYADQMQIYALIKKQELTDGQDHEDAAGGGTGTGAG